MHKLKPKNIAINSFFYFCFACLVIFWLSPMLFSLLTSIKSTEDFYDNDVFTLPKSIAWNNFYKAFGVIGQYMKNGMIVSCMKVPIGILINSLAAFALTRLYLKKSTLIFIFFLIGMMIPMQVTLVPLNVALSRLRLTNTYLGLFYVYVGFGIPFGILVLRGFMRSIPFEVDESARLDGCSNFRLYRSIILPIASPALSTLFILDFLSTWNEFLLASLLITQDKMRTVPAGLLRFFGEAGANYPLLCAGLLLSIIPVLTVYVVFQRYFVEGLTGAIKG